DVEAASPLERHRRARPAGGLTAHELDADRRRWRRGCTAAGRDLHCRPMKKIIVIVALLALAAFAVKKLQDAA
ncbi:MAG: hypothetical protein KDB35_05410, partial [Acidimicrobiales bacterium]|nr:hypothetical protein [Acidimicrobiales bacterium]